MRLFILAIPFHRSIVYCTYIVVLDDYTKLLFKYTFKSFITLFSVFYLFAVRYNEMNIVELNILHLYENLYFIRFLNNNDRRYIK